MSDEFDTQVCLVSDQAVPNLTPVLDKRYRPRRVVLVVSEARMENKARWLGQVYQHHGIEAAEFRLRDVKDFGAMQEDFTSLAKRWPASALNATGGKKTMTIAAFQAFSVAGRPIFYVETDNRLVWLSPSGRMGVHLSAELSMADYLTAYGWQIDEAHTRIHRGIEDFGRTMLEAPDVYSNYFPALEVGGRGEIKTLTGPNANKQFESVMALAVECGLATKEKGQYWANDVQARILKGGWLEQYVFFLLASHRQKWGLLDICHGLKIYATDQPDIRNEFDTAFLHGNSIHLIECKALRQGKNTGSAIPKFIYTLDSAKKSGGLMAKAMLVSWGADIGRTYRERAKVNGIRVVAGEDMKKLPDILDAWCQGK